MVTFSGPYLRRLSFHRQYYYNLPIASTASSIHGLSATEAQLCLKPLCSHLSSWPMTQPLDNRDCIISHQQTIFTRHQLRMASRSTRYLTHTPYNPSPFSAIPSKPAPGQKTIESRLTHSDDDSHTTMTIFDHDAPFGHSHRRPRRQTSYRSEAEVIDVETPPRKQQKLGPAFFKAGSLSLDMNATPPSSSQTGGFTAINAFSRPSWRYASRCK